MMCMGLLKAGDHVVCPRSMFGSTIKLIGSDLAKFGVESSFVSQTDLHAWQAAICPNTKLLFAETPTNPLTEVCDIQALADMAHNAGALFALDNCFATPALQRPLDFPIDLVLHSATKYIDGQGRVLGGAVAGPKALIEPVRQAVRTCGPSLSPFNAWVLHKALETLKVRMLAHSASALALAQWLEQQPAVARVLYPGLPSHPQHALAMRQQSTGGAVVSFELKGASPEALQAAAYRLVNSVEIFSRTGNLGDTRSIITHPASTTHGRISERERQKAGIGQGLIRLAVGLEDVEDLIQDLARGL
jgi:O-succinylhomoserine sulfhydrylase